MQESNRFFQHNGNFETTLIRGNTVRAQACKALPAHRNVERVLLRAVKHLLETANAHSTGIEH